MADARPRDEELPSGDWRAGWEDQEALTLERSLAATPLQRLEWLEEAQELAWGRERGGAAASAESKLYREVAYLHQDEAEDLEKAAERLRCSKSELIRRALRAFLDIED